MALLTENFFVCEPDKVHQAGRIAPQQIATAFSSSDLVGIRQLIRPLSVASIFLRSVFNPPKVQFLFGNIFNNVSAPYCLSCLKTLIALLSSTENGILHNLTYRRLHHNYVTHCLQRIYKLQESCAIAKMTARCALYK